MHFKHPEESLLRSLCLQELNEREALGVEAHLNACISCAIFTQDIEDSLDEEATETDLPISDVIEVEPVLPPKTSTHSYKINSLFAYKAAAALAMLIILLLVVTSIYLVKHESVAVKDSPQISQPATRGWA